MDGAGKGKKRMTDWNIKSNREMRREMQSKAAWAKQQGRKREREIR